MTEKKSIPVVTIDTAVPIPERASYPLDSLEVGESFVVSEDKRTSVQSRTTKVKAATGKEFTVRKTKAGEVRVWRTK